MSRRSAKGSAPIGRGAIGVAMDVHAGSLRLVGSGARGLPSLDAEPVTVVIGCFAPLLLRGLSETLGDHRHVRILATGLRGRHLELAVEQGMPNVLIVDEGVEHALLVRLSSLRPAPTVLVLSHDQSELSRTALLAAGMRCLANSSSTEQLLTAVQLAAQEPRARPTGRDPAVKDATPLPLTDRETEVAELLGQGYPYGEIAKKLHISESTVKSHFGQIKRKLGVRYRREMRGIEISPRREHKKV